MKIFSLAALDPRCKILLMACLSTLAMVWQNPWFLLYVLIFCLLLLFLGGAQISGALRQIRGILGLIVTLFIIQCFFYKSGDPLWVIGTHTLVTVGGLQFSCMLSLRLFILVLSAFILLTSDVRDYLLALVQLKVPYEIAFMTMASVHFLPILREEGLNVFYAVQLRGRELKKTTLRQKLETYLHICLPILAGALNRTKAMSVAMEARAFRAYSQRTYMRHLMLRAHDKPVLIIVPVLTAILIVIF